MTFVVANSVDPCRIVVDNRRCMEAEIETRLAEIYQAHEQRRALESRCNAIEQMKIDNLREAIDNSDDLATVDELQAQLSNLEQAHNKRRRLEHERDLAENEELNSLKWQFRQRQPVDAIERKALTILKRMEGELRELVDRAKSLTAEA